MKENTTKGQKKVDMMFACELCKGQGGFLIYDWQQPWKGLFSPTTQGQNKCLKIPQVSTGQKTIFMWVLYGSAVYRL